VKEVYNDKTAETILPTSGTTYNSTSSRLYLWKYSLNVISRNPVFGVGTGDLKEELNAEYSRNNWTYGIEKKYSSHNQYLHTGVILGWIGIILLCLMLFLPFLGAIKLRDWMYAGFLLIIIVNNVTEDVLEVQKGVLFYGFFNSYFLALARGNKGY
jgi:O-antigen ligase